MRNREQIKGVIKHMLKLGVLVERQQLDGRGKRLRHCVLAVPSLGGASTGLSTFSTLSPLTGTWRNGHISTSPPSPPPYRVEKVGGGEAR